VAPKHLVMLVTAVPAAGNPMTKTLSAMIDCLVIGGGPAGLTAAIYLARFHLSVVVVDGGQSRLAGVPLTRNHAGYPDGIAGAELLARMRTQAELYGAILLEGEVGSVERKQGVFRAELAEESLTARSVLIATGVVNRRPAMMTDALHDAALAAGFLRYCPICDAYEVTDKPIAVLGAGARAAREAEFLRSYSAGVTLISDGSSSGLAPEHISALTDAGVTLLPGPPLGYEIGEGQLELLLPSGRFGFASLYPALGTEVRSEMARMLGAALSEEGCILVDAHQRTTVRGLYAAGDVVLGLDQISHAMGGGGIAATTIRNDSAAVRPIRRPAPFRAPDL
jgi:thioredoxin reductase (NADPH)